MTITAAARRMRPGLVATCSQAGMSCPAASLANMTSIAAS